MCDHPKGRVINITLGGFNVSIKKHDESYGHFSSEPVSQNGWNPGRGRGLMRGTFLWLKTQLIHLIKKQLEVEVDLKFSALLKMVRGCSSRCFIRWCFNLFQVDFQGAIILISCTFCPFHPPINNHCNGTSFCFWMGKSSTNRWISCFFFAHPIPWGFYLRMARCRMSWDAVNPWWNWLWWSGRRSFGHKSLQAAERKYLLSASVWYISWRFSYKKWAFRCLKKSTHMEGEVM